MGLFDWYLPTDNLRCPVCEALIGEWQGKDGPCALLVWKQGMREPIEYRGCEHLPSNPRGSEAPGLPEEFVIYSYDCGCPFPVEAICKCKEDIWTSTDLVTAKNITQGKMRKDKFNRKLRWLQGKQQ